MNQKAPKNSNHQFLPSSNEQLQNNSDRYTSSAISRRGLERIDLLLLAIEAIDLNGSQSMVWTSKSLGLESQFPNHVELWKCRCHNPLRKTTRRGPLKSLDSDALILLICSMSERLYPRLRQLISSNEPIDQTNERWLSLSLRFTDLVSERLNTRRGAVQRILSEENTDLIIRQLVRTLTLSVGYGGVARLKSSLFDPLTLK